MSGQRIENAATTVSALHCAGCHRQRGEAHRSNCRTLAIADRCDQLKRQRDQYRKALVKAWAYLIACTVWMLAITLYAAPWAWPPLDWLRNMPMEHFGLAAVGVLFGLVAVLVLAPTRKEWE